MPGVLAVGPDDVVGGQVLPAAVGVERLAVLAGEGRAAVHGGPRGRDAGQVAHAVDEARVEDGGRRLAPGPGDVLGLHGDRHVLEAHGGGGAEGARDRVAEDEGAGDESDAEHHRERGHDQPGFVREDVAQGCSQHGDGPEGPEGRGFRDVRAVPGVVRGVPRVVRGLPVVRDVRWARGGVRFRSRTGVGRWASGVGRWAPGSRAAQLVRFPASKSRIRSRTPSAVGASSSSVRRPSARIRDRPGGRSAPFHARRAPRPIRRSQGVNARPAESRAERGAVVLATDRGSYLWQREAGSGWGDRWPVGGYPGC